MSMKPETFRALGYDERQAIIVLRKFVKKKPELVAELLKELLPPDVGQDIVRDMLLASKAQLDSILVAVKGMQLLAKHFADTHATAKEET